MTAFNPTSHQPEFFTEKQLAHVLGQSVRTLQKWRMTGEGPQFCKFGQSVRYSAQDVNAWINERRKPHTAAYEVRP